MPVRRPGIPSRHRNLEGGEDAESAGRGGKESYSGWAAFAGVIMFIVGSLTPSGASAAILNDDVVVVGGQGALIADITTWGWVHLVLGSLIAITGVGLLDGQRGGPLAGGLLRRRQRDLADRLVPGGAALGVPDDPPRRDDHLPAHRALGRAGALGLRGRFR